MMKNDEPKHDGPYVPPMTLKEPDRQTNETDRPAIPKQPQHPYAMRPLAQREWYERVLRDPRFPIN